MSLVKITYYREQDKDKIKTAVVKESQVRDIKHSLPHIRITEISSVPEGSIRDYILY